jgi:hypothetical protein
MITIDKDSVITLATFEGVADTLRRAAWLGEGGQPEVTYTSLFLALVLGPGALGRWAQATLAAIGPRLEDVIDRWEGRGRPPGFTSYRLAAATKLAGDSPPAYPESGQLSESVQETLARAGRIAHHVGTRGPIEDRHLFAVMLFDPPGHLDEYRAWRLDRAEWSLRFLRHVVQSHPAEAASWQKLHAEQLSAGYSDGVLEALAWATLLAGQRTPPATELDVELVVGGLLLQGHAHREEAVAAAWLLRELGGDLPRLIGAAPPAPPIPIGEHLSFAPDTLALLELAAPLAAGQRQGQLKARHLVGAVLAAPAPFGGEAIFARAGRDRSALRLELLEWIERGQARLRPEDRDDVAAWRSALGLDAAAAVTSPQLPGYDNDDAHGDDLLGIGRDVNALAAVLASRHITPPLSVGLFGEWGSGKSFFMHALEARIRLLADASDAAVAEGRSSSYYGRIVQIKFNAWQYMDANLWASIGTHVFDELREALGTKEKQEKLDAYAATLSSMQDQQTELARKTAALAGDAERVNQALGELREKREARQLGWKDTVEAIRHAAFSDAKLRVPLDAAAQKLGLDAAELTIERARAEREALRGFVAQASAWWRAVRGSWPKAVLALFLLLEPVVALLIPIVTSRLPALGTWAVATVAPLLAVAGWIHGRIGPVAGLLDNAIDRARTAEDEVRARLSVEELKLKAQEAQLAAEQVALEHERAALLARKAELEAELAALRKGKSFKQVVFERAASEDYRKQLGVIATAHADFEQLAGLLGDRREEPYVERIVLYIDDLDRCPPTRVVEVLQAVHLLLSLPLFVVVVAVDSRWLLQSLEAYYAQQFHFSHSERSEWESRPQHYLEKIFQIPYALPPMSERGFASFVEGLLAKRPAPAEADAPAVTRDPGPSTLRQVPEATPPEGSTLLPPAPDVAATPPAPPAPLTNVPMPRRPALDLTPRSLEIGEREIEHLRTLASLIPSPRAAKRFVNLYRIVRASIDDDALDDFIAGQFKTTQLCLASVIGRPALAAQLFRAIFDERVRCPMTLEAFLSERLEHDEKWRVLATRFKGCAELTDWPVVRRAVYAAARYSFETGRLLGVGAAPSYGVQAPAKST